MTDLPQDDFARIVEIFGGARDSVQILSPRGILLWINGSTTAVLGIPATAIGSSLLAHWPEEVGRDLHGRLAEAPPRSHYVTACRPDADGATCWWDLSLVPIAGAMGTRGGYVLACRDVTERETGKLARALLAEEARLRQRRSEAMATDLMRRHSRGSSSERGMNRSA